MAGSWRVEYSVVGLGHFGEHVVLPGFRDSRKAKLEALVSGDEKKARRLARKFGTSAIYHYRDLGSCLSNPQVEAVCIVTNNSTHAEFALEAAAAGKHVLCEEPMAKNVPQSQQMIDACRALERRVLAKKARI